MTSNKKAKFMADHGVEHYNSMPVQFGKVKAKVFGGPFKEYVPGQRRVYSVKMALECPVASDITVPTEDFGVPTQAMMAHGVQGALEAIFTGNDIYVGCGWGIGRTGTFMACLAKVMLDYGLEVDWFNAELSVPDALDKYETKVPAVAYVRKHYLKGAVETKAQEKFIADFDTSYHVSWLTDQLNPKVVVRTVEKPVYVFNPFLAFFDLFKR
jgi:hypothetical protein